MVQVIRRLADEQIKRRSVVKKQDNSWFLTPIQNYDSALSVRWAPLANQYALERDMHDSDQNTIDSLKRVLQRYSRRKIPYGLSASRHKQVEVRRREIAERLRSLQKRRRIIFFIEELNLATRDATLRTLKATDLWNHGDVHYDGNPDAHSAKVARQMDTAEEDEKQQQISRFERDIRYHGIEAWLDTKRRARERINNAGFPRSKLLVVRQKPIIVPGR